MTFNPNQIRDERGRWTTGAAGVETSEDYDKKEGARRYALAATAVAKELHFDPQRITVSDEDKIFNLNGHSYHYAGAADLSTGNVTIYADHVEPSNIEQVTAHEIGHEKFREYQNDLHTETETMFNTLAKVPRTGPTTDPMKADGTLREPYASQFPLYQANALHALKWGGTKEMSESDGISDYSRDWWKAWKEGKANTDQAYHETLAEISARHYLGRYQAGPERELRGGDRFSEPHPAWRDLFYLVEDHWNAKQAKSDKPL